MRLGELFEYEVAQPKIKYMNDEGSGDGVKLCRGKELMCFHHIIHFPAHKYEALELIVL